MSYGQEICGGPGGYSEAYIFHCGLAIFFGAEIVSRRM
jgi:hypothetical protein